MKKLFFLSLCFLGMVQVTNAQRSVVGLHLQPLFLGEIRGSYEFAVTDKFSMIANLGVVVPHALPGFLEPDFEASDYGLPFDIKNNFTGWSFVPEFRIYMNKKDSPRGFYIAPYFNFSKYTGEFNQVIEYSFTAEQYDQLSAEIQEYVNENNPTLDVNTEFTSSLSHKGFGVQFGVQWLIADRLAIDLYFLGLEVAGVAFDIEAFTPDANALGIDYSSWGTEIETELNNLDDIPLLDLNFDVETATDKIKAIAKTTAPWYRAGLKVGFAF